MTKRLAVMLALVFGLALCGQQAMAYDFDAEMVTGNGFETVQPGTPSTYLDYQTPYLFLEADSSFLHTFTSSWWWKNDVTNKWTKVGFTSDEEESTTLKNWYTLAGIDWSTDERLGEWRVVSTMDVLEDDCDIDCMVSGKCSYFNRVTAPVPEPISSTLFLLGAGAFGLRLRRRKA